MIQHWFITVWCTLADVCWQMYISRCKLADVHQPKMGFLRQMHHRRMYISQKWVCISLGKCIIDTCVNTTNERWCCLSTHRVFELDLFLCNGVLKERNGLCVGHPDEAAAGHVFQAINARLVDALQDELKVGPVELDRVHLIGFQSVCSPLLCSPSFWVGWER